MQLGKCAQQEAAPGAGRCPGEGREGASVSPAVLKSYEEKERTEAKSSLNSEHVEICRHLMYS